MRSTLRSCRVGMACAGLLLSVTVAVPAGAAEDDLSCRVGVYRSPGGTTIVATAIPARVDALRLTRLDGRSGVFARAPGDALVASANPENPAALTGRFVSATCTDDPVVSIDDAQPTTWRRVPLTITRTRFRSRDVELAGELIEPPTADVKPPLFVNVHGSESTAAIDSSTIPFVLAAQGVAAFVFDKRGTGASRGRYTQDLMSWRVVAAVDEARRIAGDHVGRVGVAGFSQGGWVAPAARAARMRTSSSGLRRRGNADRTGRVAGRLRTASRGFLRAELADAAS